MVMMMVMMVIVNDYDNYLESFHGDGDYHGDGSDNGGVFFIRISQGSLILAL